MDDNSIGYRSLLLEDIRNAFIAEESNRCKNNYLLENADPIRVLEIIISNWSIELLRIQDYTYEQLLEYYTNNYPPQYWTQYVVKLNEYMRSTL